MTKKQRARWSHLVEFFDSGESYPALDSMNQTFFEVFSNEILTTLSNEVLSDERKSKVNEVIVDLRKIITDSIQGIEFETFGSWVTGLSLNIGDIDVCIKTQEPPKKVLKKIEKIIRKTPASEIQLISKARVPVLKFVHQPSGLHFDITVNNTLAIHNSNLLKTYADCSPFIRHFLLALKYFASQRNINVAFEGTISSYAWTLLGISFLQHHPIINLPTLQANHTNILVIDDVEYDVGFNDQPQNINLEHLSIGKTLAEFFSMMTEHWPFGSQVCCIREKGFVSRESVGWDAQSPSVWDLIPDHLDRRLGAHPLPIQDPFNPEHDLSNVVKSTGFLTLLDELHRARNLVSQQRSWSEMTQSRGPQNEQVTNFDGVYQTEQEASLAYSTLYERVGDLLSERKIVAKQCKDYGLLIRYAIFKIDSIPEDSIELEALQDVIEMRERFELCVNERDKLVNRIVLSLPKISETMQQTFERLTEQLDVMNVPSLEKEEQLFASFFELQAMYEPRLKAEQLNHQLAELNQQKRTLVRSLNRAERKKKQELKSLDATIHSNKLQQHSLADWMKGKGWKVPSTRFQKSGPSKSHLRNSTRQNTQKLQEKALSGQSLSFDEFTAIMQSGGFQTKQHSSKHQPSSKHKSKKQRHAAPMRGSTRPGHNKRTE